MKDLVRLTDHQRHHITPAAWWEPIAHPDKAKAPTRPVEIVGDPIPHPTTGELLVSVRRPTKGGTIGDPYTMALDTLTASYVPRVAAAVAVVVEEPPQMTLDLDKPAWAARLERDIAWLVAREKSRGALPNEAVFP